MPTTNQGLLDAYNALFSNTPFGAAIRRRVLGGMQQSRRITGSGTRGGSSMPRGTGAENVEPVSPGVGSQSPLGGPSTAVNTSTGSVPGISASRSTAPTGTSLTDRYGPAAEGLPSTWSPGTPGPQYSFNWGSQRAKDFGNKAKYGGVPLGLLGMGVFGAAGRAIGAIQPNAIAMPGYRMPRFVSSPAPVGGGYYGGFDPSSYGVMGGQAGYQGGGPDERGGGVAPGGGGYGGAGFDANSPNPDPGDAGYGPGGSFY